MTGVCDGCGEDRDLCARSLCNRCYKQARKAGMLEASPRQRPFGRDVPFRTRLLGRLIIIPATGCWEWSGRRNANGYAAGIRRNGRLVMPHVATWELFNRTVPDGMELDHLCKVRHCCNPAHLEPTTHPVNVRRSKSAKLTERDVRDIRSRYAIGETQLVLARAYDVTQTTISSIVLRKIWREVA